MKLFNAKIIFYTELFQYLDIPGIVEVKSEGISIQKAFILKLRSNIIFLLFGNLYYEICNNSLNYINH